MSDSKLTFEDFIKVVSLSAFSAVLLGFVFMKVWLWFIVYTFKAHPLSLIDSVGLAFVASFLKYKRNKKDTDYAESLAELIRFSIVSLLIGWTITLFQ